MFGFGKSKPDLFDVLYGKDAPKPTGEPHRSNVVAVTDLSPWQFGVDDGTKFPGGFGPTELLAADYWTLRARSSTLFETNLYARGLIRRLVTNEINVGLHLEATPEEAILGFPEDGLAEWSEDVENRFALWGRDPTLCDQKEQRTFGQLQQDARMEAHIAGDCLCVMRQDPRTQLPRLQLVSGSKVQTPLGYMPSRDGNRVCHGVEIDSAGRHVAYWIRQDDGRSKRLPAYGEKSGRRLAWLVYGADKRLDDVRGKPLLSLVLQSLKEIDRYRDSTQRKAVINSMLAMFVTKTTDKPGTKPLTGGAVRRSIETTTAGDGKKRRYRAAEHIPGLILDELQQGEEPKAFTTNGTVENYGVFEEAIVQAIAWANEVPPEILTLAFSNNYSASQAAINEFKIYLNKVRTSFGQDFCQPIYIEWLLAETLAERIKAAGLLDAWRDWKRYDEFGSWVATDWTGNIKPAVDMSKLVSGYDKAVEKGFCTRARATRELFGLKYSKVVQRLAEENRLLAEANAPIAALEASKKAPQVEPDEPVNSPDRVDDEGGEPANDDEGPAAVVVPLREARS